MSIMSNKKIAAHLMTPISEIPTIESTGTLKSALDAMTKFSLGVCIIQKEDGTLEGILTDGDLRRLILTVQNPLPALLITEALQFGTRHPKYVSEETTLEDVIKIMDEKRIWDLPVLDSEGRIAGVINRHNLD